MLFCLFALIWPFCLLSYPSIHSSLPTYAKKRQEYETDLEQFQDLLHKMDEHKAALAVKIEEHSAELTITNAKLDQMNQHVQCINALIGSLGNQFNLMI